MLTRRHIIASTLAAPAILRFGTGTAKAATTLKISHQFPGGTIDKGDFRDRLCRMFTAEVTKSSGGEISAEIYPNSSLIKTNAQFAAMPHGAVAHVAGEHVRVQRIQRDVRVFQGPQRVAGIQAGADEILAGFLNQLLQFVRRS